MPRPWTWTARLIASLLEPRKGPGLSQVGTRAGAGEGWCCAEPRNPKIHRQAQAPKMKPRESPRARARRTVGRPLAWQCAGQPTPHHLVWEPWMIKPNNLGTQSIQHARLEQESRCHISLRKAMYCIATHLVSHRSSHWKFQILPATVRDDPNDPTAPTLRNPHTGRVYPIGMGIYRIFPHESSSWVPLTTLKSVPPSESLDSFDTCFL